MYANLRSISHTTHQPDPVTRVHGSLSHRGIGKRDAVVLRGNVPLSLFETLFETVTGEIGSFCSRTSHDACGLSGPQEGFSASVAEPQTLYYLGKVSRMGTVEMA